MQLASYRLRFIPTVLTSAVVGTNCLYISVHFCAKCALFASKLFMILERKTFSIHCVLCYGQGLQIADYHKPLMEATGNELLEERDEALEVCKH
jgi:hypothetical protein